MSELVVTGAAFNRGRSKQTYGTPADFLREVQDTFGPIAWDLAADEGNHVASRWLGAGGLHEDALAVDWSQLDGRLWLNPPFGDIAPWVAKAAISTDAEILVLVPASVGTNWFRDYVHGKAAVFFLRPRLTFAGAPDPFPKDLMLLRYLPAPRTGHYGCWNWRTGEFA